MEHRNRPVINANVFPSNFRARHIVLADSGTVTSGQVGTVAEDRFFKVVLPSYNCHTGSHEIIYTGGRETQVYSEKHGFHRLALFYASPWQYCEHYITVLSRPSRQRRKVLENKELLRQEIDKMMFLLHPQVVKWDTRASKYYADHPEPDPDSLSCVSEDVSSVIS